MIVTIFNHKCMSFEHLTVGEDLIYTNNLGDIICSGNISIKIDSNNRYVNIGADQYKIVRIEQNMNTWLKLQRLESNDLPLPKKATAGSAGIDFAACLTRPCQKWIDGIQQEIVVENEIYIAPNEQLGISLGYKAQLDRNYALLLYLRSSIGIKGLMLSNLVGVIDSDYRGELYALIYNRTDKYIKIKHGDRIVQGIMTPIHVVLVSEENVDETARGDGGLGSTGL